MTGCSSAERACSAVSQPVVSDEQVLVVVLAKLGKSVALAEHAEASWARRGV